MSDNFVGFKLFFRFTYAFSHIHTLSYLFRQQNVSATTERSEQPRVGKQNFNNV